MILSSQLQVIKTIFRRKSGYQNIQSSKDLEYQNSIKILNAFTPQGSSHQLSIRIGKWGDNIGVGYYRMESATEAKLTIIFIEKITRRLNLSKIPLTRESSSKIIDGYHHTFLIDEKLKVKKIIENFDIPSTSKIIYSILSGDNVIIIHPDHDIRASFVKIILTLLPEISFQYNRITTGCSELEGNENIIGVEELNAEYRSHKKIHMSIDTIFIDLKMGKVLGEGLKNNDFTDRVAKLINQDVLNAQHYIYDYFQEITQVEYKIPTEMDQKSISFIKRIRKNLGLTENEVSDWFVTF